MSDQLVKAGPLYVSCPRCHAEAEVDCSLLIGDFLQDIPHVSRILKAKQVNPYPPDDELKAMFPSVDEFAKLMRRELWANRRKGTRADWLKVTSWNFWVEIQYHAAKFAIAVRQNDKAGIAQYAADVGNMTMMLADVAGSLEDL